MNWQKLSNPLVSALLRSPLHRLLDQHTMVLTLTGLKSGKRYTFPVSYVREGADLLVISQKDRTWWKNLRGGAPVLVSFWGHTLQGRGETLNNSAMSVAILLQLLQTVPAYQRFLHLPLDATGQPRHPEDFSRLAQDHVIVRIQELTEQVA